MVPIKEKLRNLQKYMPNEKELIYQFGRFLADRLNSELVPTGFLVAMQTALYDLQKGVDGYSGQLISNKLVGYPPIIYSLLSMRFMDITHAVCPDDFAKDVEQVQKLLVEGRESNR